MTREQYDMIKSFAHNLTEKRLQMPDGQLLDACQEHLDTLLEQLADNFEEHPHQEAPESSPPPYVEPPRAEPEPEPPLPPPSEPPSHVRHTAVHKRPTPRKTHR